MDSKLNPYLNFDGKTREAMEFYRAAFGGELKMMTFGDGGMPHGAGEEEKIMHASLVTENGLTIMSSDVPKGWSVTVGTNVSLSLNGEDEAELRGYWDKLSAGAEIGQPLTKASWGDTFGMFTDKFGIRWMVNIAGKKS